MAAKRQYQYPLKGKSEKKEVEYDTVKSVAYEI